MTAIAVVAVFVFAAAALLWHTHRLHARIAGLQRLLEDRKRMLENNSKLLIEKNIELLDQNMQQQHDLESRGDFVGVVSHQLRTPATELRWGIDAIIRDTGGNLSEAQRSYLDQLEKTSLRMVTIIDHLLRLVKIDQKYYVSATDPYDPNAVIREVVARVGNDFPNKRIQLSLELQFTGTLASIDSDSLDMVLANLIENAFHYTPEGGRVTVSSSNPAEGGARIAVADTGIGIPEERRQMIFAKFQRAEAAQKMNSGGMGMGLYIVKNLVERYGGTVGFETETGKGTMFWLTLPEKKMVPKY